MATLEFGSSESLNEYIRTFPNAVKRDWLDILSANHIYFNNETISLLEFLSPQIPNIWDDLIDYSVLSMTWAREYEHYITRWQLLFPKCRTNEDFEFVASHLDKLPYNIKNSPRYQKFAHLFDKYHFYKSKHSV